MPKLDNFLNHKAKMVIELPDISKTRSTVKLRIGFPVEIGEQFQTARYVVF